MNLDEALKHTAVIGAAGKMGRGISLLLLQELALVEAQNTGSVGKGEYRLDLIDANYAALNDLRAYLQTHVTRFAERRINALRDAFAKNPRLVSNEDVITAFVQGAMCIIQPASAIENAKNAVLVFEAVVEDLHLKIDLFKSLAHVSKNPTFIFTNTSSIPIHVLNKKGDLHNRIIGFHFYNPPPVQKLVELIPLADGEPLLYEWANELAQRLKKCIVLSRDVAGFIGNGFLIREVLFACAKVRELQNQYTFAQSVYMVNKVTQDFMLRPMGIFQLLDYVGLNVCSEIGKVMNTYLPDGSYDDELIEELVKERILGGQDSLGYPKNGIFKYEMQQTVGIYTPEEKKYSLFDEGSWKCDADSALGPMPAIFVPWKALVKEKNSAVQIHKHFEELFHLKTLGAELTRSFLCKDAEISQSLVSDGIAFSADDVKTVLTNGFYHLFGPEEKACAR